MLIVFYDYLIIFFLGVRKVTVSVDQHFDDTIPNKDYALINNDAFETQVMNFGFKTQPKD